MPGAEDVATRKQNYFGKLVSYLDEYPKIFVVACDNVGSNQMQNVRRALRGKAVVLMGKNTMIRKAIRGHLQSNAALESILPHIKGNVGFIFTKDDLSQIKKVLEDNMLAAVAKAGSIAPCDVILPPQQTALDPSQTSFFQALNIPTKIAKGSIEIINPVHLLKPGQKVGASEANLLAKLDVKPFKYGLGILIVYDNGFLYEPKVLDITDDYILTRFKAGVANLACASLGLHIPNKASVPHMLSNGYKNILSVALGSGFEIKQTQALLNAATAAPVAAAPVAAAPAAVEKKEEKKEEEEEEDVGAFGLFGDD